MATIMISCGEASGDLYAGSLVTELQRLDPAVRIFGFGGPALRAAGAQLVGDYHGLTVTGLAEALAVLPRSYFMLRRLVAMARAERPDVFVAIDFPDFNFRLIGALHRLGIPIVYYVSPQLWAWRPGRMGTMRRLVDRVLVIFPFEEAIYRAAGVPVQFVGHPLVDLAQANEGRAPFLRRWGLQPDAPTVALLPGSRPNELRAILPRLARAAGLIADRLPAVQFLVARAPNLDDELFAPIGRVHDGSRPSLVVVESATDEVLASSDLAITASGTATVQAAIHACPMVVVYRLSALTYRLGKRFVKVDTYGMVNLVAGERIVPELIQDAFTPEAVAREALALLTDPERAHRTRQALRRVRARLGGPGATQRAAAAVLQAIGRPAAAGHRVEERLRVAR
jgi:lipid-A-disaccharide synthase